MQPLSYIKRKIKKSNTVKMILTFVRRLAPIASQAQHFPPYSGEADTKEERICSFYYFYRSQTKEYSNDSYKKVVLADLNQRERIRTVSRSRTRGRCQRS